MIKQLAMSMVSVMLAVSNVHSAPAPIERTHAKDLQLVRDRMKDPSAVQFRALHVGASGALCGEMNAKNSYGGYVGFKPFVVQDGQATIVTDEGREERKDLSNAQWAWERQLDQQQYEKACAEETAPSRNP